MRILFAFAFLAACSNDKGGTDAGASNDAAPADVSTADAPTDTGPSGDACMAMWSSCQNCTANSCSTELVACTMDTGCKNALATFASCANACGGGVACKQAFSQTSGAAGTTLLFCMVMKCQFDCAL